MNHKSILTKLTAMTAVVFAFTACSENIEENQVITGQNNLGIGVNVHQGWNEPQEKRAARYSELGAQMKAAGMKDVLTFDQALEGKPAYLWVDAIDGIEGKGHSVTVESMNSQDEQTRGTLMSGNDGSGNFVKETFYDDFAIWGDKAVDNTKASWKHDNEWTTSNSFTWTDDNSYTFYAVAPFASGITSASKTSFSYTTALNSLQQKDLMVGTANAKRSDRHMWFNFDHVLSAIRFKLGNDFSKGYIIKKIELQGIMTSGTYTHSSGSWSNLGNKKTVYADDLNFATTDNGGKLILTDGNPEENIAGNTFVILPQNGTTDSYVIITVVQEDNPTDELSFYTSLNGQVWAKGYSYTYTISNTPFKPAITFSVETNPEFIYSGDVDTGKSDAFKVTSYRKESPSSVPEAIPWTFVGFEEYDYTTSSWKAMTSEKPEWVTSTIPTAGNGDTGAGEQFATTVESQTSTETQRGQLQLRNAPTKGTAADPLDLSLFKVDNTTPVARTTANSYIVRQGGYYKIPLVIGNTIKGGAINAPESYSTANASGTFKTILVNQSTKNYQETLTRSYFTGKQTFVDYNDNPVTATNYKVNASTAEILWHDFQHNEKCTELIVITDVDVTSEGADALVSKFLTFRVDEKTIQQGNAVIVVKDTSGKIMWSWHIYITDRNWLTDVTDITSKAVTHSTSGSNLYFTLPATDFTISNYNLGYVEKRKGETFTYPERKVRLTFKQEGTSEPPQSIEIIQHGASVPTPNEFSWDTKYQWGRKDALPGTGIWVEGDGDTRDNEGSPRKSSPYFNKFYSGSYTYERVWPVEGGCSYGYATQNPLKRLQGQGTAVEGYGMWSDKFYVNAWSATQTKPVCPVKSGTGTGTTQYQQPEGLDFPHAYVGAVKKTIYDPCPAGFKVPPSGIFSNVTKNVNNVSAQTNSNNWNISGSFDFGYKFYAKGTNGATIFFPATGRLQDTGLRSYATRSWVWSSTAGTYSDTYISSGHANNSYSGHSGQAGAHHMSFQDGQINPLNFNQATMPQSIRPMVDTD